MKPVPLEFEDQVKKTPDATALIQGERRMTWRELNERSNSLAHELRVRGAGPEVFTGLSIPQSIEAIVGVMGILKAGGAYVPLDPGYPEERTREVIRDARLSLIVDENMVLSARGSVENPECLCELDSVAYVLYTSGSSGKPKGVMGIHRSIVNGLLSVGYASDERCCLNASLSFGFSLANLFLPLITGIPLVILSAQQIKDLGEFLNIVERERITRVVLVPPVFKQILELPRAAERLRNVRAVGVAGAALTTGLLRRFAEVMPQAKLHNTYSASEIGTLATLWTAPGGTIGNGEIVIGKPVANTSVHLLDEDMKPAQPGAAGEIYVGAPHLARGYLNQPEETARRFVLHDGERLFRTGDLGRLRPDGEIEYVGRADDMVKIRGYRIELSEIEQALAACDGVRDAAAAAHEIAGEARLVGYIVSDRTPGIAELRENLRHRLPEYMIPATFVFLDRLPLSSNGKVDRAALSPPLPERPAVDGGYVAPRNEMEAALAGIWSDVLGLGGVGIYDHLIELGGDSLLAVQIAARIWDHFGVELTVSSLFDHGTIAGLAPYVSEGLSPEGEDALAAVK